VASAEKEVRKMVKPGERFHAWAERLMALARQKGRVTVSDAAQIIGPEHPNTIMQIMAAVADLHPEFVYEEKTLYYVGRREK